MKKILRSMRSDLKALAAGIRAAKLERRTAPNGFVYALGGLQHEFRHKHVIRCLLRGKTLEQIENKPKFPLNEFTLRRYWLEATGVEYPTLPPAEVEDEALRACAP